jgi:hypothetical protein
MSQTSALLPLIIAIAAAGSAAYAQAPTLSEIATAPRLPSEVWVEKVRSSVRHYIVLGEEVLGNPMAEVDVVLATDGTILSKALVVSSGVLAWDTAVMKALEKVGRIPVDSDGRVPQRLRLAFRPKT